MEAEKNEPACLSRLLSGKKLSGFYRGNVPGPHIIKRVAFHGNALALERFSFISDVITRQRRKKRRETAKGPPRRIGERGWEAQRVEGRERERRGIFTTKAVAPCSQSRPTTFVFSINWPAQLRQPPASTVSLSPFRDPPT